MTQFFGEPNTRIIFAADLPTLSDNESILSIICDEIDVIKVGSPLIYAEGMGSIGRLASRFGKPVFADLKVADVPHTNAKIIDAVRENGGAATMVHGFIGPDGLQESLDAARGEIGIIVQLELTNPGGLMFTAPLANGMANVAASLGVYGTQAPGNRPERIAEIRSIVGPHLTIVCCGVGAQGGQHKEVLTSGGDYSIVGRAIYRSPDPLRAIAELRGQL